MSDCLWFQRTNQQRKRMTSNYASFSARTRFLLRKPHFCSFTTRKSCKRNFWKLSRSAQTTATKSGFLLPWMRKRVWWTMKKCVFLGSRKRSMICNKFWAAISQVPQLQRRYSKAWRASSLMWCDWRKRFNARALSILWTTTWPHKQPLEWRNELTCGRVWRNRLICKCHARAKPFATGCWRIKVKQNASWPVSCRTISHSRICGFTFRKVALRTLRLLPWCSSSWIFLLNEEQNKIFKIPRKLPFSSSRNEPK